MTHMLDVIIIGGSYAGCAGAIQLGRARRSVVVIDAGQRRNRFAAASHGFLGQDGRDPGEIARIARAEALAYPTVQWREGRATEARKIDGGFAVRVDGDELHARRLVLAYGVIDELPELPGLAERWGRHVFHCPYCHGYELNQGSLGVLGIGPMSAMKAQLVADWGPTTLYTRGLFELDADQLAALAARNVAVERTPVTGLEGCADVRLADGRLVPHAGLFILSRTRLASPLAAELGCAIEDGPLGPIVTTDAMRQTTVPGVYAAGDLVTMAPSVTFAVADGVRAAVSAHQSMIFPQR